MSAASTRSRAAAFAVAVLAVCALAALALPHVPHVTSAAAPTSVSASATGNSVVGATCASSTAWSALVTSSFATGVRDTFQRLSTGSIAKDDWTTSSWNQSNVTFGQSGALYCDSSTAAVMDATTDQIQSNNAQQSTWGLTAASSSTLLIWVQPTNTGRLFSMASGASGGNAADRVLWVDTDGTLVLSGYDGTTSWSLRTTAKVLDGRFHLVAVVMAGYTTGGATVYVDGSSVATASGSSYPFRNWGSQNVTLYLGYQPAGTQPTGAPTSAAKGTYDEVVLVSTTPSATLLGGGAGSFWAAGNG